MRRKLLLSIVTVLIILFLTPSSSFATNSYDEHASKPTDFPRCPNPKGSIKASYDEGWHWIAGESELRWGSDYVYDIGDQKYVQCYCEIDGNKGIQTNWLPTNLITDKKQDTLIGKGWILVENGADFGLPEIPYLAKNTTFKCNKPNKDDNPSCHTDSQTHIYKNKNSLKDEILNNMNFDFKKYK